MSLRLQINEILVHLQKQVKWTKVKGTLPESTDTLISQLIIIPSPTEFNKLTFQRNTGNQTLARMKQRILLARGKE